jgi:hypothetical protein
VAQILPAMRTLDTLEKSLLWQTGVDAMQSDIPAAFNHSQSSS